jgi:ABC-type thiamin/hydroxymethylpyrimidine transport system permease subunit
MKGLGKYLATKDLVTIALLSALGGVLSTYVGYLGNLMNHMIGVPFGAGQFMAGLHVLWIILAIGITKKKGTGTATGLIKGVVELFTGSTHGIVIVVVSVIQGITVDAVLFSDRAKERRDYTTYAVAGAVSSAVNVIVFQALFFSGVPLILIAMLCMLAGASGMIFGGWLAIEMLEALEQAGMLIGRKEICVDRADADDETWRQTRKAKKRRMASMAVVSTFLAVFSIGAVYYFMFVFVLPGGDTVAIDGAVESPFDFLYEDYSDSEVTVNAELVGSVTYVAPMDYTGVPLMIILADAVPSAGATEVVVWASDGYFAVFALEDVMADDELILTVESDSFRLVAADYDGAYWVRLVTEIEVR